MSLDLDFVRKQFPAFQEPSLKGQAFFENAGGSYACQQVIDRLTRFYTQRKVQPYSPYSASRLGGEEMDEARLRMAAWLGVDTDEVSFGPSTTQNTYVLAEAFRTWLSRGDAIIVTNQDHEANTGPWRRLSDAGINVREWRMNPETGHLDIEDLAELLDHNVRLVCVPHCSNVVGEINPIAEITALAHAEGAFVCVDGVSYAPHGLTDVGTLGPDIYLFSSYKTYGPHQGVMVIRRNLAQMLPNQGHFFNADTLYKRFTPAGPDHAQVAACAGIIDYFEDLAAHHGLTENVPFNVHNLMRDHEIELLQPLLTYASEKNSVRLLGPSNAVDRAPTVTLVTNRPALEISKALSDRGFMVGAGDFYAVRVLQGQNVPENTDVLRLSFVHYTSKDEVDGLMNALDDVL